MLQSMRRKQTGLQTSDGEVYARKAAWCGVELDTWDMKWAKNIIPKATRFRLRRKGQLRGSISCHCKGRWLESCIEGDQSARSF